MLYTVVFAVMVLPRGIYVVTIEHSHPISNENLPQHSHPHSSSHSHSHLHIDDFYIHKISITHNNLNENEIEVDNNLTETDLTHQQHHSHQHHCYFLCEQEKSVPVNNSANLLLKQIVFSFVQNIDSFAAFSDILLADWKKYSVESFLKTPYSIGLYVFYQNFRI
jgi:hypothetical protein